MSYFSDRELGPAPRIIDELPDAAWRGIVAVFNRSLDSNLFAEAFPEQCPDGEGISGTSRSNLIDTLVSHVPDLGNWPRPDANPGMVPAMDLVEFCWRYSAEPTASNYHSFYRHDHLRFDEATGRSRWLVEINLILSRNGVSLELGEDGQAARIGPPYAALAFEQFLPASGDAVVDRLLATAVKKYRDPDLAVRRESLEQLWDALERIKTVLNPDKKSGIAVLIAQMGQDPPTNDLYEAEFSALTTLGNNFQIRHHETTKWPVPDHLVDYLFIRAYSLLVGAVLAVAR
jgi:hypothetical protein